MRTWVLILLCLVAVIAYVQRIAISVPAGDIQRDLGFGTAAMGWVMTAWYTGYAALQIPCGWLADRWGSRRALTVYAMVWSLLTGATALATDFGSLVVLWGAMGLAQAGAVPAAAKAIGDWLPETRRAFASGLFACSMAGGAALSPFLSAKLLGYFRWQELFLLYTIPGLVWAQLFYFTTPDAPRPARHGADASVAWGRLVRSTPMALLCLQQFLRAAAMVFFYTWFPTYLKMTRNVSLSDAGTFTAWPGIGAMLGGLSGGYVSDWLLLCTGSRRLSRQGVAVVGMVACTLLTVAAYFVTDTQDAMLLLSLGAFAGTFGGVSGYSVAITFGGQHVGTVFSVMNMCGNIGAALFPLGVGWFVERYDRWDLVLFFFAFCFAADAVCWALLNPRGTLFEETHAPDRYATESLSGRPGPG